MVSVAGMTGNYIYRMMPDLETKARSSWIIK